MCLFIEVVCVFVTIIARVKYMHTRLATDPLEKKMISITLSPVWEVNGVAQQLRRRTNLMPTLQ